MNVAYRYFIILKSFKEIRFILVKINTLQNVKCTEQLGDKAAQASDYLD